MKGVLILLLSFLFSCSDKAVKGEVADQSDSTSIVSHIQILVDTSGCSALKRENDSLNTALFIAQFKVARVQKYLNICLRNPSQDKFLKGWIKRAIQ